MHTLQLVSASCAAFSCSSSHVRVALFSAGGAEWLAFGVVSGALSFQHYGSCAVRSACRKGEDGCWPTVVTVGMCLCPV